MKFRSFLLGLTLIGAVLVSLASAQDAVIPLDHQELGTHQRPFVRFDHDKHSANNECEQCHHDYDQAGKRIEGEGQSCATCHGQKTGRTRLPLQKAFHTQCKACHASHNDTGGEHAPVTCGECHVRR